jgi:hypothetical protein
MRKKAFQTGMKHGQKIGGFFGRQKQGFGSARSSGGVFAGIGQIGRKSTSTLTPQQLARSGKMRSAMVAGGVAGMGAMNKRRGSGVSKTSGRPTGMYGY